MLNFGGGGSVFLIGVFLINHPFLGFSHYFWICRSTPSMFCGAPRIDRAKVLGWDAIDDWLPDATLMQQPKPHRKTGVFFNGITGNWGGKRNMVGG